MISHVKNVTDETYFTEEANEKEGADRIAVNLELDNVQREVELLSEITKKLEGVEVSSATVANAIFLAIPLEKTKIDTAVFKLARSLKTLPECSGANGLELKPIVKVWHEMSKAFIEEGYFDDTWSSFLQGWKGVKIPLGEDPIQIALQRAAQFNTAAINYDTDSPFTIKLICVCAALQELLGEKPFFLACRKGGEMIGVSHDRAWRLLRMLEEEKILQVVKRGDKKHATRYRYIGNSLV